MNELAFDSLVFRLRERARIRRQIPNRKSVQEGQPDRIANLLEEAADEIESLQTRLMTTQWELEVYKEKYKKWYLEYCWDTFGRWNYSNREEWEKQIETRNTL